MPVHRIFLLSPARCGGKRAEMLCNDSASFDLALRIRQPGGVGIGQVFSFLSGLYFRGKLAYANSFASAPEGLQGAYTITSNRGLLPVQTPITVQELRAFGDVDIDSNDDRYRAPLLRDAHQIRTRIPENCQIVLLGSVASGKYVEVLLEVFGNRLHFPADFVGRGDMSRGGLMLRCVEDQQELSYIPVIDAVRRGARPPKLTPRPAKKPLASVSREPGQDGSSEERSGSEVAAKNFSPARSHPDPTCVRAIGRVIQQPRRR